MQFLLILAIVIALVSVVFALQNFSTVAVNFLVWQFNGSLALILLFTLGLGVIVGLLVSSTVIIKRSWKITRQNKKLKELESLLQNQKDIVVKQSKRIEYLEQHLPSIGDSDSSGGHK